MTTTTTMTTTVAAKKRAGFEKTETMMSWGVCVRVYHKFGLTKDFSFYLNRTSHTIRRTPFFVDGAG